MLEYLIKGLSWTDFCTTDQLLLHLVIPCEPPMRWSLLCLLSQFTDKKTEVQSRAEVGLSHTEINCKTRSRTQAPDSWCCVLFTDSLIHQAILEMTDSNLLNVAQVTILSTSLACHIQYFSPLVPLTLHLFISQIFIEYLLHARDCSGTEGFESEWAN